MTDSLEGIVTGLREKSGGGQLPRAKLNLAFVFFINFPHVYIDYHTYKYTIYVVYVRRAFDTTIYQTSSNIYGRAFRSFRNLFTLFSASRYSHHKNSCHRRIDAHIRPSIFYLPLPGNQHVLVYSYSS